MPHLPAVANRASQCLWASLCLSFAAVVLPAAETTIPAVPLLVPPQPPHMSTANNPSPKPAAVFAAPRLRVIPVPPPSMEFAPGTSVRSSATSRPPAAQQGTTIVTESVSAPGFVMPPPPPAQAQSGAYRVGALELPPTEPTASSPHGRAHRDLVKSLPFTPTGKKINEQALRRVQAGFRFGQRRAYYAARSEFIAAMRTIAQAKDIRRQTTRYTHALAAGLRALDEATDFVPVGTELDVDLDMRTVVAAHATPVLQDADQLPSPQVAVTLYHQFAQRRLAGAVAGVPAGSLALHGLGKLHARLATQEPGQHRLADTRAMTCQRAALLARDDNYLAANELGVLLTGAGHYGQAKLLFEQVLAAEPNPVTHRNLAFVARQLGEHHLADMHEVDARSLAEGTARVVSPAGIVEWVSPQTLVPGKVAQNAPQPHANSEAVVAGPESRPTTKHARIQTSPWKQIWREAHAWVSGPVRVAQRPEAVRATSASGQSAATPPVAWP